MSRPSLLRLGAVLLALTGLIGSVGTLAAEPDADGVDLRLQVMSLLDSQRFDELETMALDWRATDVRVRGGNPKIYEFYRAMEPADAQNCLCQQPLIESRMRLLDAWLKEKPDSYVAHLAMANLWVRHAWGARGADYASQVTPEQWSRMRERLDQAASHLKGLDPSEDPYAFIVQTNVGQLQSWSLPALDAVYEAGIRSYPTFFPLYAQHANLLQEKWFGRPGELAAYINSVPSSLGGEDGAVAYSYIAFRLMEQSTDKTFYAQTGLDWSRIKAAYAVREERYGLRDQDWNALCQMAVWVPDHEDAKIFLAHVDGRWDPAVWRTRKYYDAVVAWIQGKPSDYPWDVSWWWSRLFTR